MLFVCDLPSVSTLCIIFFFKQKTAYEMRISDWSSDVCSSDLAPVGRRQLHHAEAARERHRPGHVRGRPAEQLAVHEVGDAAEEQIGRASCRERVCQYV